MSCWKYQKWCSYFENPYHHAKIADEKRINILVTPYCILVFSRKQLFHFSEVALVSVHCNCLIGCISDVAGSKPAQVCFQDFWAHKLAWTAKKISITAILNFLDSTKLTAVWKKIIIVFKRRVSIILWLFWS